MLEWTGSGETFGIFRGPIFDRVFNSVDFVDGTRNIAGFVQAADDTREVINYMHSWPLPVEYVDPYTGDVTAFLTPVTCGDSGGTGYDLSISADSGLQVPVQMVPNDEGREFIVTIGERGSGRGIRLGLGEPRPPLTALQSLCSSITVTGRLHGLDSPFEFALTDLAKGASVSWTRVFIVDPAKKTTISWDGHYCRGP